MTSKAATRVRNFRKRNLRLDVYPGQEAQKAVSWFKERNPSYSMQEVLDALICAGARHLGKRGK